MVPRGRAVFQRDPTLTEPRLSPSHDIVSPVYKFYHGIVRITLRLSDWNMISATHEKIGQSDPERAKGVDAVAY